MDGQRRRATALTSEAEETRGEGRGAPKDNDNNNRQRKGARVEPLERGRVEAVRERSLSTVCAQARQARRALLRRRRTATSRPGSKETRCFFLLFSATHTHTHTQKHTHATASSSLRRQVSSPHLLRRRPDVSCLGHVPVACALDPTEPTSQGRLFPPGSTAQCASCSRSIRPKSCSSKTKSKASPRKLSTATRPRETARFYTVRRQATREQNMSKKRHGRHNT